MAIARTTRNSEEVHPTREDISRDETWSPPSMLEAPPAREGMRQRWVSTQILGQDIPHHTMKRFREGWSPRPADTIPKDFPVPTIAQGQWAGHIGIEGMILCEMPETKVASRISLYILAKELHISPAEVYQMPHSLVSDLISIFMVQKQHLQYNLCLTHNLIL